MKGLIKSIKLKLGILSVEEKLNQYIKLEKELDIFKGELGFLMKDGIETKRVAELKLLKLEKNTNSERDFLIKAINGKYNNYFSLFLDRVKIAKDKIEGIKKAQSDLLKNAQPLEELIEKYKKESELIKNGNYKYKEYLKNGLDRERETMPQINPNDLDSFLIHFSDKAKIKKEKMKLKEMKPSQKDFNENKILNIYKNGNYKDHKYILSQDGYLMDGHHNWASGLEDDENYSATVYKIDLPIKNLLRRSNLLKISTKRDANDKEIKKAVIVLSEVYKLGKISDELFEKSIRKARLMLNGKGDELFKAEEKDVRPINREVLNPDDGIPQKASKDYVMYNDISPSKTGKENCKNCGWFNIEEETCQIVKGDSGDIKAEGWCTLWGIDLLLKEGKKTVAKTKEVEKDVDTPANKLKEDLNVNHHISTMWQLEDKLKKEGKIVEGQSLVFFCPVHFPGQSIVDSLLNEKDEHGEKILFPLPRITDKDRIKVAFDQMRSLGIASPETYITEDEKTGKKGLLTYSTLPGIEGVHNNKYEYIANEFVQLGAFQIVPNEWVNEGDPINETYRFPGEDGYSPYWRIPPFEELKKLRPDLVKHYEETDQGIIKKFEKEEEEVEA